MSAWKQNVAHLALGRRRCAAQKFPLPPSKAQVCVCVWWGPVPVHRYPKDTKATLRCSFVASLRVHGHLNPLRSARARCRARETEQRGFVKKLPAAAPTQSRGGRVSVCLCLCPCVSLYLCIFAGELRLLGRFLRLS